LKCQDEKPRTNPHCFSRISAYQFGILITCTIEVVGFSERGNKIDRRKAGKRKRFGNTTARTSNWKSGSKGLYQIEII